MKCTKTIPCGPCVSAGLNDQCQREQVITTKHIRQASKRSKREVMVRITEHSQSREEIKHGIDSSKPRHSLHHQEAFPTGFSRGSGYSESDRYAYSKGTYAQMSGGFPSSSPGRAHSEASRTTINEADSSSYNEQADIENAANSLELLAWGRQRESGLSPTSSMVVDPAARSADILLPRQAKFVLCYHRDYINWTHNTIHWPRFFKECHDYWLEGVVVEGAWLAIYYAALCVRAHDRSTICWS
jgi:hypothetical protein